MGNVIASGVGRTVRATGSAAASTIGVTAPEAASMRAIVNGASGAPPTATIAPSKVVRRQRRSVNGVGTSRSAPLARSRTPSRQVPASTNAQAIAASPRKS